MKRLLAILLLAVPLAACAYDPPVQGDRESPAFRKALKGCGTTAGRTEAQRNGTPGAALVNLFDFHATEHRDVQSCMQAQGYAPR